MNELKQLKTLMESMGQIEEGSIEDNHEDHLRRLHVISQHWKVFKNAVQDEMKWAEGTEVGVGPGQWETLEAIIAIIPELDNEMREYFDADTQLDPYKAQAHDKPGAWVKPVTGKVGRDTDGRNDGLE